jgi:hypothetical protein
LHEDRRKVVQIQQRRIGPVDDGDGGLIRTERKEIMWIKEYKQKEAETNKNKINSQSEVSKIITTKNNRCDWM